MIALTKSSMIYWTIPIFTAIFANIHLKERITSLDWIAVFLAFAGIVIMQNPFGQTYNTNGELAENVGTLCAFLGAVTGGMTFVSVKKMGKDVHYIMSPLSWCISNLIMMPFLTVLMSLTLRPELHSYSWYDISMLVGIALC